MNPLKLHSLEYSISQDAYHISSLSEVIKCNLVAIYKGRNSDYLLIGVFYSYEEAFEFMNKHNPLNPTRILSDII